MFNSTQCSASNTQRCNKYTMQIRVQHTLTVFPVLTDAIYLYSTGQWKYKGYLLYSVPYNAQCILHPVISSDSN
jgi:hypothetical protein